MTYCQYVCAHPEDILNSDYHDNVYGFPLEDDSALFERLVLEINQAGLSWNTILKKQANFNLAYDGFLVDKVAAYSERDIERLLSDAGIIRNRRKVLAAIENARRIKSLRNEFDSFRGWLEWHHPRNLEEWTKLFKRTFVFTGREIVKEFLLSTGFLPGAHDMDCSIYKVIEELQPAWMKIFVEQDKISIKNLHQPS